MPNPTYQMEWHSKDHTEVSLGVKKIKNVNPLTPMSDQDRISPHNIKTKPGRQEIRAKKNTN